MATIVSLTLNVILGVWLVGHGTTSTSNRVKAASVTTSETAAGFVAAPGPNDLDSVEDIGSNDTGKTPSFHWSQIESADYRQFTANLRAVGCPEVTIRDIVVADLMALYRPQALAIWPRPHREYWQKRRDSGPTPVQIKQLQTLANEQNAVFGELLGTPFSQQGLIDTLTLQVHGTDRELLFLAADKREAAARVLAEADFETREMKLRGAARYSREAENAFSRTSCARSKACFRPRSSWNTGRAIPRTPRRSGPNRSISTARRTSS